MNYQSVFPCPATWTGGDMPCLSGLCGPLKCPDFNRGKIGQKLKSANFLKTQCNTLAQNILSLKMRKNLIL